MEGAIESPDVNHRLRGADREDKFAVYRDAGELRLRSVAGNSQRALQAAAGIVHFDLRLRGFSEIDQAVGPDGKRGGVVDRRAGGGLLEIGAAPGTGLAQIGAELVDAVGAPGGGIDGAVGV